MGNSSADLDVSLQSILDCRNAYDVLDVESDCANDEVIRRSYLRRSMFTHPDKNGDDIELATRAFQKVSSFSCCVFLFVLTLALNRLLGLMELFALQKNEKSILF